MSLRMQLDDALFVAIPSMIPAAAHIQIESVGDFIRCQTFDEERVCHEPLGLDDTEFSVLLAQRSVDVSPLLHPCADRPCRAVLDNQQLAKAHSPSVCRSRIINFPHELPFPVPPDEPASIGLAAVAFFHLSAADVVVGYVCVSELFQQFTRKSGLTTEYDILLGRPGHLTADQIYPCVLRKEHFQVGRRLDGHGKTLTSESQQGRYNDDDTTIHLLT